MRAALFTTAAVLLLLATWANSRSTAWRATRAQGANASRDESLPSVSAPPAAAEGGGAAPEAAASYQTAAFPPGERRHVVEAGDTLESISRLHYGDESHATEIYEANRDQIRDPATLHAGQTLVLP
jgi:nucleoid-associated protein YgaU